MQSNIILTLFKRASVQFRRKSTKLVAIVFIYAAVQLAFFSDYLLISVTLNGKNTEIVRGTKVSDLGRYYPGYHRGDLFDVTGRMLEPRGGQQSKVRNNGKIVKETVTLSPGVRLRISPGLNSFEEASNDIIIKQHKLVFTGKGPLWVRTVEGYPGRHLIRTGHISKRTASFDIYPPQDTVYQKLTADHAKYVAFTFDDGPSSLYTQQIMNVLKANNVKGSFFVVGSRVEQFPWLVRAMLKDGHTIGNHTFSHGDLTRLDESGIRKELTNASEAVRGSGGGEIRFFRPPYGSYNSSVTEKADLMNYTPVFWNIDTRDWTGLSAQTMYEETLNHLKPGAVVLMHDGGGPRAETVKALSMLLPKLKELGYTVVSLDQMMRLIEEKRTDELIIDN